MPYGTAGIAPFKLRIHRSSRVRRRLSSCRLRSSGIEDKASRAKSKSIEMPWILNLMIGTYASGTPYGSSIGILKPMVSLWYSENLPKVQSHRRSLSTLVQKRRKSLPEIRVSAHNKVYQYRCQDRARPNDRSRKYRFCHQQYQPLPQTALVQ